MNAPDSRVDGQVPGTRCDERLSRLGEGTGRAHVDRDAGGEVLHQVAGLDDAGRDPFRGQVLHASRRGSEAPRREVI